MNHVDSQERVVGVAQGFRVRRVDEQDGSRSSIRPPTLQEPAGKLKETGVTATLGTWMGLSSEDISARSSRSEGDGFEGDIGLLLLEFSSERSLR